MLSGRVFITGGAGFLGRGILRKAQRENWPCEFVVYSRDEQKHFSARKTYPNARYVVGDILDTQRLLLLMSMCDYAIHTAALKYIPECEAQPSEAMRVNIDGTRSFMDAAAAAGIKRSVLISTDKAAAPINTYGMTKALMERRIFETSDMPAPTGSEFVGCRYGNVIGSTGSIWPVFKDQAARRRKLSVTNPDMTRFFFGIDDAVNLIMSAFGAPAATVVIPQPSAIRMGDLAVHVTQKWGLDPFDIVGHRLGEKTHEQIVAEHELPRMVAYGSRWVLLGPTQTLVRQLTTPSGMSSDMAAPLSAEEFVEIALDSESV